MPLLLQECTCFVLKHRLGGAGRLAFVSLSNSVDYVDGGDNGAENLTPSEQFGWRRLMIQVTESFSLRQLAKQTGLRRDNFLRPDRLLGRSLHNHQPDFPTFIGRMVFLRVTIHELPRFGGTQILSVRHGLRLITENPERKASTRPKLYAVEKTRKSDRKGSTVGERLAANAHVTF